MLLPGLLVTMTLVTAAPSAPAVVLLAVAGAGDTDPASPAGDDDEDDEEADDDGDDGALDGNPPLAGVAAGAAALGTLCGAGVLLGLLAWVPLLGLVGPVLSGLAAGTAGWALAGMAGKRRVPLLPLWMAGWAGACGAASLTWAGCVLGGLWITAGYPVYGITMSEGSPWAPLVAVGCGGGLLGFNVLGGMGAVIAYLTGAAAVGVLAAWQGRGLAKGEAATHFDFATVADAEPENE